MNLQLAVQAATGATRHFSFEALITLQQQLCLNAEGSEDALFNSRLSRVVAKLFARVVKAEAATYEPFSSSNVDMEAVICFLEDTLVACERAEEEDKPQDGIAATRNLAKLLVTAILKARGETASMRTQMDDLEIDPASSALGKLLASCAMDLGLASSPARASSSRDVAALVSAVGNTPQGPERDAAIEALKRYKATHGYEALKNHLQDVSPAFRAFIVEQLSDDTSKDTPETSGTSSMSERIKNLRSKLNATEAVVQSAVDRVDSTDSPPLQTTKSPDSGVAPPSPSKLPTDGSNEGAQPTTASSSVRAFRERLAAAQDKITAVPSPESKVIDQPTVSAGSRAATLRARLQAVKKQSEQQEF
jgi:hypothetical protein